MLPLYRRLPRIAAGCAATAVAVAFGGAAFADPAPSYDDLLARLDATPGVTEAAALADAAEARVRQARVRPNPELALESENLLGTGPFEGYGNAETTLSVSQNLELFGRRGARIDAARADAAAAVARRLLSRSETAARLALAYAEAEAADRRAALAQEALTISIADARAALALVEEGREPLVRGLQAEAEAASARASLDEANAERAAAFARLTAVAQLPAPVTSVPAGLLDRPVTAVGPTAVDSPAVQVAEAEREAAQRRIRVETLRSRPDVRASVGVRRFELENATALTLGVSLPLPLFDRNRGNTDAARAELRAAEARLIGARQTLTGDRSAAEARLRAAAGRVGAVDQSVTAAEEAYRLSRIGFEAGRISQLELRASRAALVSSRNAALDARAARVRAEIDLARLNGRAPYGTSTR